MPDKKTKKPKERKPFFDYDIEINHECKNCGHKEIIIKRVTGTKKVITPAIPAEVEIVVKAETVKTLNDFTKKE